MGVFALGHKATEHSVLLGLRLTVLSTDVLRFADTDLPFQLPNLLP